MPTLTAVLASRPYPGRVCLVARTQSGAVRFVYALTGRSDASRSRSLRVGADSVEVVDEREAGIYDELRHYVAAARSGPWIVVGNGDHVHPLAETLRTAGAAGKPDIEAAWALHTFEPDPPIYTPRIWLAANRHPSDELEIWAGSFTRSETGSPQHSVWRVDRVAPGSGRLLTTYNGPVGHPNASGELTHVAVEGESLIDEMWSALGPTIRIAAIELTPDTGPFHGAALRSSDRQQP